MTATVTIPLGPDLSAEQAEAIYNQGKEAVIFALLELAKKLGEQQSRVQAPAPPQPSPSTPSGMIAPYQKTSVRGRRKKPGRKQGHAGVRRQVPERIDRREEHRAERCPDCGGPLIRCQQTRTRYVEDIPVPEDLQPQVTEHTLHRDWCPPCRNRVEPKVPDALPGATLGNRVLGLAAWLPYALGNTLSQIVDVFNYHLQLKVTPGGLVQRWYRLQTILFAWYEQIQQQALHSAVLHADESGWRVKGKTQWLWCFTTTDLTYYRIDRARGSPALQKFFIQEFAGTLVSDFWGAYNAVACALRQTCLVHLLRDLQHVERYTSPGQDWPTFAKKLRRLVGEAIRLWRKRNELLSEMYASRRRCLSVRLQELIEQPWEDPQARRLIKRLRRHQDDLFTFLDHPNVPFDNNHAERAIRPAVIIRKNSYGNRSERGADAQAVLMSVFRTLKQRGHDPITTITQALATYLQTGQLPSLPQKVAASG
jgi:transposase